MEAVSFWGLCKIAVLSHVDRMVKVGRRTPAGNAEAVESHGEQSTQPGSQRRELVEIVRREKPSGSEASPDAEPL